MSASLVVDGSPPVATAFTAMSRSVTIPQGLSFSITTTEPIRKSLIAFAASTTEESALKATGFFVITSATVFAICNLQSWNTEKTPDRRWLTRGGGSVGRLRYHPELQARVH